MRVEKRTMIYWPFWMLEPLAIRWQGFKNTLNTTSSLCHFTRPLKEDPLTLGSYRLWKMVGRTFLLYKLGFEMLLIHLLIPLIRSFYWYSIIFHWRQHRKALIKIPQLHKARYSSSCSFFLYDSVSSQNLRFELKPPHVFLYLLNYSIPTL